MGTTDKKSSHKIRHRKIQGEHQIQQEEIGQWDILFCKTWPRQYGMWKERICGATDIALTQLGHEQAIETGKKILEEKIHADEILYSPLMRAADTAKHISEITGIPAREELRLKEQNFGIWESTPRGGEDFKKAKQSFACSYEGGSLCCVWLSGSIIS